MDKIKQLFERLKKFLTEVRSEMKKVSFPSRDEVFGTTSVVLVTSALFAVYLWVVDKGILLGLNNLFKALR
ncbi:MAG: preprotein translocase subunit SecE [Thermoanaerobaculia bacterium]